MEKAWCRDSRGRAYSFSEFMSLVEGFHGYSAPGVLLGGAMVAAALDRLIPGTLFDAICETRACLPDAVQLLTPCTLGNGWLRLHQTGRFALTLFDKETGEGARSCIRADRLDAWPQVKAFLFKTVPKKLQDAARLRDELREGGTALCTVERVRVSAEARKKTHLGPVGVCPECGEGYPLDDGSSCRACQGFTYLDR